MKKSIFCILILTFFGTVCFAQVSNIDPICQVYGAVQGTGYDGFKKMCSKASSTEACENVLKALGDNFNMATLSREDYVQANVEGCKIVLQKTEDVIYWSIEGSANIINAISEIMSSLSSKACD